MRKIQIKKKQVWVGNKTVPLISGEVHYWRHNPNSWKKILEAVKEMGIRVVSTYIPWDYHEYQKGKFDFTGKTDPSRDLKRFLELTRSEGFWLIIRPGPYIYSEWPNEGAPEYAYRYHRLHPQFLSYAQTYIQKVCQVLKPYLATKKSGHIILLQADNEIDPWPDTFGHQYGLGDKPGLFQKFLKNLYQNDLAELNANWATTYQSFEEAGAFIPVMLKGETGIPLKGDHELKRYLDYLKFKHFYSQQYAEWVIQAYRKQGINVPIYLNLYPFFYAHDWHAMQSVSDLVGIDLYPWSEFSEDEFEQRKLMDKVRYLRTVSSICFIPEFEAGVWHNRHYETGVLPPNHYRLIVLSAMIGGATAWNWYMLVNRDNWYMSPINEWGRPRPELYEVFKQLTGIYHKMQPATLQKLTEVAVTYNPLQYAARTVPHNSPILTALYESDIDYELYDPRLELPQKKVLFYSGNDWLSEEAQRNLHHYVEQGGILVAFREYPRKDDRFESLSLVGFEDPKSILFEFKRKLRFRLAPKRPEIELYSSVFVFEDVPNTEKIIVDLGSYGKQAIGYIKKIGKGKIVHLGVEPTRELMMEVLNYLNIPLIAYSTTKDIKTALFKRGSRYYLVAVNNGNEDKSANIYLPVLPKSRRKMQARNLMMTSPPDLSSAHGDPFTLNIPRKDGVVLEISL